MPGSRAAEIPGNAKPHVVPSGPFDRYAEFYPEGSIEELRFRFTSRLREAMRMWRILLEQALRAEGQTRAQWETLLIIAMSGDKSTQKSLAQRLRIEGPTLVRLLDKLEQDKLIQRVASLTDRRSNTIQPTAKGRALVATLVAKTNELRADVLGGWSIEELEEGIAFQNRFIEGFPRD
jgi:MarR family transcriptional regulator for hemolysin